MNGPDRIPVFCALDTTDLEAARRLAAAAAAAGCGIKLGKEFFAAHGPEGVRQVRPAGAALFLDLKFHDIPNTVAGAVRAAIRSVRPDFLTIHAGGGGAMVRAAAEAAASAGSGRPRLLAVTVLTSLDAADLAALGIAATVEAQALRLAKLAQASGADGAVCAAGEIAALRGACGGNFLLVVPGIRPAGAEHGDQKRVMTPGEALKLGADWLVIGRPITGATDPAGAARALAAEIKAAA
ncbi:MAG TPA: orotidine-5'-phosphate decarboxylase [Candidatus Sulfotelmatobacter sp.]|nr:orotidine-5'-phosphate decarboxylase [Candidatus Sulfotelmatobacter sp.]